MKRIEEMKIGREKINRERKLLSERISLKKKEMIAKFEVVMRHNKNISKDEIYKKILLKKLMKDKTPLRLITKKSNLKNESKVKYYDGKIKHWQGKTEFTYNDILNSNKFDD